MASEPSSSTGALRVELISCLGVEVPEELLTLALTHPSAVGEGEERTLKSNQRLEFLGDAIVGAIAAEHFYRTRAELPEGTLTQYKAASVRGSSLAKAARRLNLGKYLIVGRGEESGGGRDRDTLLADAFEAVIGAIFLAHGFETAREFVLRALAKEIENVGHIAVSVKNRLQETTQAIGLGTPVYQSEQVGPVGPGRFHAKVLLQGQARGEGKGKTKQDAESRAAEMALNEIESSVDRES
jgi:ribonuclease-3